MGSRIKGIETEEAMRGFTFGIELEFVGDRRAVEQALRNNGVNVGGSTGWNLKYDASVTGSSASYGGGEMVSPILTYDRFEEVRQVCEAAKTVSTTRVDRSCGVHVHVGVQGWTMRQILNFITMWFKYEDLIMVAGTGTLEDRRGRWCKNVGSRTDFRKAVTGKKIKSLADLRRAWYGDDRTSHEHYHASRYHDLNVHAVFDKGTLEVRIFNGSLNPEKLKAYVDLVLGLAARAKNMKYAQADRRKLDGTGKRGVKNLRASMRHLIVQLGLSGDEFKTTRKRLLERCEGDLAYIGGRPSAAAATTEDSTTEGGA